MTPRPRVAILSNAQTPYRQRLHIRIAQELPDIELWSLFTHDESNAPWQLECPAEIRPVFFARPGERSADQHRPGNQISEWKKGGVIADWLRRHSIAALVTLGYNDAGRLRLLRYCRKRRLPCFLFGDSNILGDASGWKGAIKGAILPAIVRRFDGVLYCGALGLRYFLKYGAAPDRCFAFPYEPDYESIASATPNDAAAVRLKYGIPEGRRRILYSGRLAPEKRVDLLLSAFSAIADSRGDWDLVIAGGGPLGDSLRAGVPQELASRIHWTGFISDHRELAALYRACDLLVLPSDYEPWGVVVTEAAVCMALVCSSVVGAAADLVREGENGYLFTRGDAGSLTESIRKATDAYTIDRMKAESPRILGMWRAASDPVEGLRRALTAVGVISEKPQ